MGQRAVTTRNRGKAANRREDRTDISVFRTPLGWVGLAGRAGIAFRLWFGHTTANEVRQRIAAEVVEFDERDWRPELRERLTAYAGGEAVGGSTIHGLGRALTQGYIAADNIMNGA